MPIESTSASTATASTAVAPSCGTRAPSPVQPEGEKLVRYEALFKLTEEVLAATTVEQTCAAAARHLKYIADAAAWRLLVPWGQGYVVVDGQRGAAQLRQVAELPPWEAAQWQRMLPELIVHDAHDYPAGAPAFLSAPGLCRLNVKPVMRNGEPRGLLFTASRHRTSGPLEVKFLHMVGALVADQLLSQLTRRKLVETLEQAAGEDVLTGAMNRRAILQALRKQMAGHRRTGLPICVLMLDVDHFKSVNDRFGHPAGDEVLRELSLRLASSIRDGDHFGRFGGEEFLVILAPCQVDGARVAAERLREAVARTPFHIQSTAEPFELRVTVSIGGGIVEGLGPGGEVVSEDQLLKAADEALYRSKKEGRNRVNVTNTHFAQPPAATSADP